MKKRNPNATCGTCPYWDSTGGKWQHNGTESGYCAHNTERFIKAKTAWCGQHPDFWEAEVEQVAPKCEPTQEALEEIARLLNEGEHSEALKEFRRMHGLANSFVCTSCGNVSSSTGPGFVCRDCGGYLTARVVIEHKEAAQ